MGASTDCLFADLKPSSGYIYGCRCDRCASWAQADRKRRKAGEKSPCQHLDCPNPKRPVQGAKYCEDHGNPAKTLESAKRYRGRSRVAKGGDTVHSDRGIKIQADRQAAALLKRTCVRCQRQWPDSGNGNPYSLCSGCRAGANLLVKRALRHNVPAATLLEWLDRGTCGLCGDPLRLAGFHKDKPFNIDHDHQCCPGEVGCERCVRDILCNSCNTVLGRIEALRERGNLGKALSYVGYRHEEPCQPGTELTIEAPTSAEPKPSETPPTPIPSTVVGAAAN